MARIWLQDLVRIEANQLIRFTIQLCGKYRTYTDVPGHDPERNLCRGSGMSLTASLYNAGAVHDLLAWLG
jgi:hypothetical protein